MTGKKYEIYEILKKMEKLNADIYSDLLNKYGESLVNEVIEKMIDMDINYLTKFDYYISKISYVDDVMAKDVFDVYISDLSNIPTMSREDNIKLATEIHYIVEKLKLMLDSFEFNAPVGFFISDKVDACLEQCADSEKLIELKKLYNKFLYKRNMLTEGNLRWVISVAKKYYKNGIDFNELIQLGNIGLMKACERYDPTFNTYFSTYSYYWIRQSITRGLIDVECPVSVPSSLISFNISMRKSINCLMKELRREPTPEEIAEHMGDGNVDKVRLVLQAFSEPVSLNEAVNSCNEDDEITILDAIEDESADIFSKIVGKDLSYDFMNFIMSILTENEFEVLCHRYELNNCSFQTLNELGNKYGVSRERIRQIEDKAIKKVKRRGKYLVAYLD